MTELKFYEKNDLVKVVGCTEIAPQTVCEFKNYYDDQITCEVEPISNEVFEKWYSEGLYINGKVFVGKDVVWQCRLKKAWKKCLENPPSL